MYYLLCSTVHAIWSYDHKIVIYTSLFTQINVGTKQESKQASREAQRQYGRTHSTNAQ